MSSGTATLFASRSENTTPERECRRSLRSVRPPWYNCVAHGAFEVSRGMADDQTGVKLPVEHSRDDVPSDLT